ncbi:MAG: hypothetical protein V7733_11145 [Paraglaciecola polaris]|uniref:hypothetical protein n=1 Tax=Paraglaciecola polaris TaxID=222814 RepID=UPI003001736C|tara:strand:- start:11912 stop:12295 length:384 start_codon:yes stop_codon:yes gene_type:complete
MIFTQHHRLDLANKLVIFEASGHVDHVDKMEVVIKKAINLAHIHNLKGILLELTDLSVTYDNVMMMNVLVRMHDEDWLGTLRMARLVPTLGNVHGLIDDICQKFDLPIKNFETKSKAIAWLLYNYER